MEKSLEACFINDVLNIWRWYFSYAFQHLKATSAFEDQQNKVWRIIRMSTNYSFQKFSMTKNLIPNKIFPWPKISYPTNFFHDHEIRLTHSNKISTFIKKWICLTKPTKQISVASMPNTTWHILPKFMSYQHCLSFTMSNSSTIQKYPKAKIITWSQEFPTKPYNVQNFNKE